MFCRVFVDLRRCGCLSSNYAQTIPIRDSAVIFPISYINPIAKGIIKNNFVTVNEVNELFFQAG